jgi:hypothetical protein
MNTDKRITIALSESIAEVKRIDDIFGLSLDECVRIPRCATAVLACALLLGCAQTGSYAPCQTNSP